MSRRFKCPKCGNEDRRKIQEIDDKTQTPLYYSMQGAPVYPKALRCGECNFTWSSN